MIYKQAGVSGKINSTMTWANPALISSINQRSTALHHRYAVFIEIRSSNILCSSNNNFVGTLNTTATEIKRYKLIVIAFSIDNKRSFNGIRLFRSARNG